MSRQDHTAANGDARKREANSAPTTESVTVEALREVVDRIANQRSCASAQGECYRDHEGCYVADSLGIAREVLARFEPKPEPHTCSDLVTACDDCKARFQAWCDEQDQRSRDGSDR